MAHAFEGHHVRYACTDPDLAEFYIGECSRTQWWRAIFVAIQVLRIIAIVRPQVVVSTGSLPGLVALIVARIFGARTIWIDSIANTSEMSLSGRLSRPFAHHWLTQWPEVSARTGATYAGAVL
jgi:UDP-N-acetylglucosamine:LPS N-acetylglucosamine transferase